MSLIRQLWLLLLATVVVGVLGSALVTVGAARGYIETELRLKNSDNAQALALTISQQGGDLALAELAVAAQFDTGYYERIRLVSPEGKALIERQAEPQAHSAPAWFVRLAPIASQPGVAQVSSGWRTLGTLEVVSASSFAYADLWRGSLRSAGWLALVGLLAAAIATLVLRRIRTPLDATVEQAQALVDRRFVTVDEPRVPELRQLSRAMNTMVQRLRAVFAEQGAQLESLRRQAQTDPLTGMSHRAHFMAQLGSLQDRDDAPAAASLLLLRAQPLAALNLRQGHAETDAMLRRLADTLGAQAARHGLGLGGRLNGADFALLLSDADGPACARDVQAAVREALAPWPEASVAIGAVPWRTGTSPGALMQAADAALARAEAQGGFGLAADAPGPAEAAAVPSMGEAAWRRVLQSSLDSGAAELGAFPVVDRDGRLIHLECPLRLRLQTGGPLEPAARWLPWALRGQLSAQADLVAVGLALDQIDADGRARGVNLAVHSLGNSAFVVALLTLLAGQAAAARQLWLEVGERAAVEQLDVLRALAQQLRPQGVKLGLEHAGERLARIDRLYEAGLDYIKLDASLAAGLGSDASRGEFVRGLVWTLHGLGMQVYAEGVRSAADAEALWACGVDGVTGPWVGSR